MWSNNLQNVDLSRAAMDIDIYTYDDPRTVGNIIPLRSLPKNEWKVQARRFLEHIDLTLQMGGVISSGVLDFYIPIDVGLKYLEDMKINGNTGWFRFGVIFQVHFGYVDSNGNWLPGWSNVVSLYTAKPNLDIAEIMKVSIEGWGVWNFWGYALTPEQINTLMVGNNQNESKVSIEQFFDWLKRNEIIKDYIFHSSESSSLDFLIKEQFKNTYLTRAEITSLSLLDILYLCLSKLGYNPNQLSYNIDSDGGVILDILPITTKSWKPVFVYRQSADFEGSGGRFIDIQRGEMAYIGMNRMGHIVLPFKSIKFPTNLDFYPKESFVSEIWVDDNKKERQVQSVQSTDIIDREKKMTQLEDVTNRVNNNLKVNQVGSESIGGSDFIAESEKKQLDNIQKFKIATNYTATVNFNYMIPFLLPGDSVLIRGLGNYLYDGSYIITQVEHSIGKNWGTTVELIRDIDIADNLFIK